MFVCLFSGGGHTQSLHHHGQLSQGSLYCLLLRYELAPLCSPRFDLAPLRSAFWLASTVMFCPSGPELMLSVWSKGEPIELATPYVATAGGLRTRRPCPILCVRQVAVRVIFGLRGNASFVACSPDGARSFSLLPLRRPQRQALLRTPECARPGSTNDR